MTVFLQTQALFPGLDDTLRRQRGKHYDFGDYLRENSVFEQVNSNVDLTPVSRWRVHVEIWIID